MNYAHIAARAYNRPLLLDPSTGVFLFSYLNKRLGIDSLISATGEHFDGEKIQANLDGYDERIAKTYSVDKGIAIIPVDGTLVHKSGYVGSKSGMMGYDGIAEQIDNAISNPMVRGIMLDIDSGGGEVSGVEAVAAKIKEANAIKPVWAHANEMAASAAYWLGSSASKLYLSNTSSVGSIGVLTAHRDKSKALEMEGEKVTLIYSGAHKVDGNPYESLPQNVIDDTQAELDSLRLLFAETVSKNRGMTVEDVLNTEAQVYRGKAAVDVGLADGVLSFSAALDKFKGFLSSSGNAGFSRGVINMTNPIDQHVTAGVTEAQLAEAITQARAEGVREGIAQGAQAERERISAVYGSEAAKGKEATAMKLATSSSMSAESIAEVLQTVPVAATQGSSFLAGISQGAGLEVEAADEKSKASLSILEAARAAQGVK